jgi:hypothetical protein
VRAPLSRKPLGDVRARPLFLAVLVTTLLSPSGCISVSTQQLGSVAVRVSDETGTPLAGTVVSLECPAAGEQRYAITDADGRITSGSVRPGKCRVQAGLFPRVVDVQVLPGSPTTAILTEETRSVLTDDTAVR